MVTIAMELYRRIDFTVFIYPQCSPVLEMAAIREEVCVTANKLIVSHDIEKGC
jgi:hypothetical protein